MGEEIDVSSKEGFGFVESQRLIPYPDFATAAKTAIHLIKQIASFQFFSITRVDQDEIHFIFVEDEDFGIPIGHVIPLDQAVCPSVMSQMKAYFISAT